MWTLAVQALLAARFLVAAAAWAAIVVAGGLVLGPGAAAPLRAESGDDEAAARALIREGARYLESGNVERASRQFERAVQLAPADPIVYVYLARARGAARRFEEAHKVLAKAVIHAHDDRRALYEIELARGDLYRDEGKLEQARAAYLKAADLRFFNREARDRLRALEQGSGGPEEEETE